jgi:hypothetical protein
MQTSAFGSQKNGSNAALLGQEDHHRRIVEDSQSSQSESTCLS